jgi:hypothetical protein
VDLFSQLQSTMAGSQAGDKAMDNGLIPSSSQPRGSQQLWIAAIAAVRSEILNLNKLADSLRRVGEEQCDREVIGCTHKLQGVLDKLKTKMSEMNESAT